MGRLGLEGFSHLENLLLTFRDLDRVLATLQPDKITMKAHCMTGLTHPVMTTAAIGELPLPRQFIDASGVSQAHAAQQLAVEAGLLAGKTCWWLLPRPAVRHSLVNGGYQELPRRTGEDAFPGPLVALANQKYERFTERYGKMAKTGS